jgi:hypothetical protein
VLSTPTTDALAATLARFEARQEHGRTPATLLGLFRYNLGDHLRAIEAAPFPVPLSAIAPHAGVDPLPAPVLLRILATALTSDKVSLRLSALLSIWLHEGRQPIGFGFLHEAHPVEMLGGPAAAPRTPVRTLSACDTDGRFYRITRTRSAGAATTVLDRPTNSMLDDPTASALYQLLTLIAG